MSTQSLSSIPATEESIARRRAFSLPLTALLYGLVPLIGLAYVLVASYATLTHRVYARANGVAGELLPRHSVGQSFTAQYNRLSGISVSLANHGPVQADLQLSLRKVQGGPDIVSSTVPASQIRGDNTQQTFSFPPVEGSKGQSYYLKIESPGANPGKAPALYWWQPRQQDGGDAYSSGVAYIDDKPQNADLAFGLQYSPSPLEVWADLLESLPISTPLVLLLAVLLPLAAIGTVWKIKADVQNANPRTSHMGGWAWILPLLLCAALAHGLLYMLLIPPWQGPDEPGHFAYAALLDKHDLDNGAVQQLDWQNKDRDTALIGALARSMSAHGFTRYVSGYSAPNAPIEPDTHAVYSELRQPPTYYWLTAAVWRTARQIGISADPYGDPEVSLRLMRFISVLLGLGVVILAWAAGRLLAEPEGLRAWLPLLLPLTVLLLPMHAFAGSVANNDMLAELAVSALAVAIIGLLRWPRGLRGVMLAALVIVLAFLSSATKPSAIAAALPLTGLALGAWICLLFTRPTPEDRIITGWKSRFLKVSVGTATLCVLIVAAFFTAPGLFQASGTASGWKIGNDPMKKAPVLVSMTSHAGQRVLYLSKNQTASQQLELANPHPALTLSLSGYVRPHDVSGAKAARAVVRLEMTGAPTARAEAYLYPAGWRRFNVMLRVPPEATRATIRLFAREGDVEFDNLSLSSDGIAPVATLLNPSYEQDEQVLAEPLAQLLPREALWMAEVATNPQTFDRERLWSRYADGQFRSFWGNFGWVSLPLPDGWFLFWQVVALFALFGLILKTFFSPQVWGWRDWLRVVFLLSLVLAVLIGFVRHTMLLAAFGIEAFPQGRYLFVLAIPIAWLILDFGSWILDLGLNKLRIQNPRLGLERAFSLERSKRESEGSKIQNASWVWANLLLWFAAFALWALVVPYFYG